MSDKGLAIQVLIIIAAYSFFMLYLGYKWREIKWNMEHEARRKAWSK